MEAVNQHSPEERSEKHLCAGPRCRFDLSLFTEHHHDILHDRKDKHKLNWIIPKENPN